jgi:hypothetical protein
MLSPRTAQLATRRAEALVVIEPPGSPPLGKPASLESPCTQLPRHREVLTVPRRRPPPPPPPPSEAAGAAPRGDATAQPQEVGVESAVAELHVGPPSITSLKERTRAFRRSLAEALGAVVHAAAALAGAARLESGESRFFLCARRLEFGWNLPVWRELWLQNRAKQRPAGRQTCAPSGSVAARSSRRRGGG